jgi:hypothetical protein
MLKRWWLLAPCLLLLAACNRPDGADKLAAKPETTTSGDRSGAISRPPTGEKPLSADVLKSTHWPPAHVGDGKASISCDTDYDASGDGEPLSNLEYFSVLDAMSACRERGVVRLRYRGKIDARRRTVAGQRPGHARKQHDHQHGSEDALGPICPGWHSCIHDGPPKCRP